MKIDAIMTTKVAKTQDELPRLSNNKSGKAVVVGGMNHYWSANGVLVVEAQSTSGQRTKQYSFVRRAL